MHYLPDTNDEDAVAERYWPDGYKSVLRKEGIRVFASKLNAATLTNVYRRFYSRRYMSISEFVDAVVGGIVIGAENGADAGFELVYASFLSESALPVPCRVTKLLWPANLGLIDENAIGLAIIKDYRIDDGFLYAYKDGYTRKYASLDNFISRVADIVVSGTINGISTTLEKYYRAFIHQWPLPPMRRNPKRLKTW